MERVSVVITGGGTGGHVYPALSVAEVLGREHVHFIGVAEGPEARLVPAAGFRFSPIPSRKMSRRLSPAALLSAAVAAGGVARAVGLLRVLRPSAVLGTGGYASGPVVLAAALLRIPTLIHEGNSIPGRTNRWLARAASRVAISYEAARRYFPASKTVLTGLPIRREIMAGRPERLDASMGLDSRPLLFAFGGSLGAESINRAVREALPRWQAGLFQVLHQTGPKESQGLTGESPSWYHQVPYVEAMADALARADVVVCRCGASTLAEVTAVGRPAILAPYPYAHADHQTANARALVEAGAGVLVPDSDLTGERLADEVERLMGDSGRRAEMSEKSRALARPDAAERVADVLQELAAREGKRLCLQAEG